MFVYKEDTSSVTRRVLSSRGGKDSSFLIYFDSIQNWIRRKNMKRRAVEEVDTSLPSKRVHTTSWRQYLKSFSQQKVDFIYIEH